MASSQPGEHEFDGLARRGVPSGYRISRDANGAARTPEAFRRARRVHFRALRDLSRYFAPCAGSEGTPRAKKKKAHGGHVPSHAADFRGGGFPVAGDHPATCAPRALLQSPNSF
jgi:hypothetical protein